MKVLREARGSVDRLVNEVGVTSSVIQHLEQESARISMVTEAINSIAEQTNLLALIKKYISKATYSIMRNEM